MRKNKLFNKLICIISIFCLNSCSIEELISQMNEIINSSENLNVSGDLGYNLQLLDNAFNGKVDENGNSLLQDFSTNNNDESIKDASRLDVSYNVTDLEYLDYFTPSIGEINGLVIPIEFPDAPAKYISDSNITPYDHSVSSYYYNSSYGKLNMNFDVVDWIRMPNKSSYYENYKLNNFDGETPGASAIIIEALSYLENKMDLSKYDNDGDGYIDSLYIIYSTEIDSDANLWWAYQYLVHEYYSFDDVKVGYYVFAGYDFLFDENKNCNATTYIHETGHMFGLEDYYDYDFDEGYNKGGLGGADMMDYNIGDHNPFSKLSLGWIDNYIYPNISTNEYVDITIDKFDVDGDVILLYDNNVSKLDRLFNDYFMLVYLDPKSSLNKKGLETIYYSSGIKVYRVHAKLKTYNDYYDYDYYKYDNSYTDQNLIDAYNNKKYKFESFIYSSYVYDSICASDTDLFRTGDSCETLYLYDNTNPISYSFEIIKTTDKNATIRIYKN